MPVAPIAFAGPNLRALTISFHLPGPAGLGLLGKRLVTLGFMESVPVPRVGDEVALRLPDAGETEAKRYGVVGVRWYYDVACPIADKEDSAPTPSLVGMSVEVIVVAKT